MCDVAFFVVFFVMTAPLRYLKHCQLIPCFTVQSKLPEDNLATDYYRKRKVFRFKGREVRRSFELMGQKYGVEFTEKK
jgi:hypothetical protein